MKYGELQRIIYNGKERAVAEELFKGATVIRDTRSLPTKRVWREGRGSAICSGPINRAEVRVQSADEKSEITKQMSGNAEMKLKC